MPVLVNVAVIGKVGEPTDSFRPESSTAAAPLAVPTPVAGGRIVEYAEVKPIFGNPMHPYTQGLLKSIPRVDEDHTRKARLEAIPGLVRSLLELPKGCKFSNRCKYVFEKCGEEPELIEAELGHMVRCWLHGKK